MAKRDAVRITGASDFIGDEITDKPAGKYTVVTWKPSRRSPAVAALHQCGDRSRPRHSLPWSQGV